MWSQIRLMFRWQRIALVLCVLGVTAHFTLVVLRVGNKIGDFDVNREFGRRFLAGEYLYKDAQCFNYMPVSALYWSPLAWVPPRVGMAVRYLVALFCLGPTLRWLHKMVFAGHPWELRKTLAIAFISLLLASHYLVRDLDDGGPHIILLGILVGGFYCLWQGRKKTGALWLGLAAAVKITPGLIVPFLLWKRQWRLAAYTSIAALGWIILPALWMGPPSWWRHQQEWSRVALSVFRDQPDPLREENEMRVQNQALKPALMRFLVAHLPGDPLRLDHAGYRDFLNLNPAAANRLANLALLLLVGGFCSKTRQSYCPERQPDWVKECGGLLLMMLLLSPLTWLQHAVWALPAIYVIVAANQKRPGAMTVLTLAIYALFALALNRETLGRSNYLLLLSYHVPTTCFLLLLLLSMQIRPAAEEGADELLSFPAMEPEPLRTRRAA
jgi:alpha-1,2-mannosyltransferase